MEADLMDFEAAVKDTTLNAVTSLGRKLEQDATTCMVPASHVVDTLQSNEHHVSKYIQVIRLRSLHDICEVELFDDEVIPVVPSHGKVESTGCLPQMRRKRDAVL